MDSNEINCNPKVRYKKFSVQKIRRLTQKAEDCYILCIHGGVPYCAFDSQISIQAQLFAYT